MERRLAAIVAADFAGFSAMAGRDEIGTVRAVRGHMDALELTISLHRGRVVKTMGDGLLAEFGSTVDAATCAAAMQDRIGERNAGLAADKVMNLRIGIHSGEVLLESGDIFGDGVNIAARIESVARPGSVVISDRVHAEIAGKCDLSFRPIGTKALKNIARPPALFELDRDEARAAPAPISQPLPDKPSIAVLPLLNMSANPDVEYLADGLTEDIIGALAHVPWLFVIARNSTFAFKGIASDVRQIGRDLGVAYLFEGSVRSQGNRLRVTGQLVETTTGAHLWSDRFDGTNDDVFALQDQITEAVTAAIAPSVQLAEIARSQHSRPELPGAYDHYLRALAALNRARITDAIEHLDQAIAIQPDYAKAIAIRAWCSTLKVTWVSIGTNQQSRQEGVDLALRALALDDRDLEVAAYCGYTLGFLGADVARGFELLGKATNHCPSFAWAWTSLAILHTVSGDGAEALRCAEIAQRLNPRDLQSFRVYMARSGALARLGRWEESAEMARQGIRGNPGPITNYIHGIAAYIRLGRMDAAHEIACALMVRHPEFKVSKWREHHTVFAHQGIYGDLDSIMQAVGLPA